MLTMTRKEVVDAVGMSSPVILALAEYGVFPEQLTKGVWLRDDVAGWMSAHALPGEMPLDKAWPLVN